MHCVPVLHIKYQIYIGYIYLGGLHFTEGEPLVEKSWEFDGCHHLHQHRDYSIHCHDQIDQNKQRHDEYPSYEYDEDRSHEYDEYHLHEHCPDEQTTEQIVSTKFRSQKTRTKKKAVSRKHKHG